MIVAVGGAAAVASDDVSMADDDVGGFGVPAMAVILPGVSDAPRKEENGRLSLVPMPCPALSLFGNEGYGTKG